MTTSYINIFKKFFIVINLMLPFESEFIKIRKKYRPAKWDMSPYKTRGYIQFAGKSKIKFCERDSLSIPT